MTCWLRHVRRDERDAARTAAAVGTARMIRWQAQALLSQSAIAQAQAKDLGVRTLSAVAAAHAECARAAELQSEAKLTVQPLPGQ
jgi:hypothetical protein